mgnify:CR=1 FL=1
MQNLPKKASDLIRRAIIAPENSSLIFADYSGQEVRILAAACRDTGLLQAFNPCYRCIFADNKHKCPKITPSIGNPDYCHPKEVHSFVTSKVFKSQVLDTPIWEIADKFPKLRDIAKAVTFLLVYGGSELTLAQRTGISLEEAKKIFEEYFAAFPGIKRWIREMYEFALANGYSQDVLGRRRYYDILNPDLEYDDPDCPFYKEPSVTDELRVLGLKQGKEHFKAVMSALRKAQNQPIQGTAAEMTKQGSLFARRRFQNIGFRANIIGFVHDK